MDDTNPIARQGPDSADTPISHLLPESEVPRPVYSADERPSGGTHQVRKPSFFRTWLATASSLRPTGDPTDIKWGIHWYTPVSIIFLLLVGTTTAIGHHFFYRSLNGRDVGGWFQQRVVSFIGWCLVFLTKVTLTGALGISRTQWVWLTLRRKLFTLDAIDSVFGVISDPTFFLNWRMLRQAKVATVMAIAIWMSPLTVILAQGSISVQTVAHDRSAFCSVPTLLFEFDNRSNATTPTWGNDIDVVHFWSWRTSDERPMQDTEFIPDLMLTAYTGTISRLPDLPPLDSPNMTIFGEQCGVNCSYTVDFLGPAIACAEFTVWGDTHWHNSTEYMHQNYYLAMQNPAAEGRFLVGIQVSDSATDSIVFECKPSTAHYTVNHHIQGRRFQDPVITKFEVINLPGFEPNPIYPNTAYLAHYGLYDRVFDIMKGEWVNGEGGSSESVKTSLMRNIFTNASNVGVAIEEMAKRMIVSMITFNHVYNGRQTVLSIAATQRTICTTTDDVAVYYYSFLTLALVYGLAVACALASSIAGFIALRQNGMASTRTVSAIIRTTRNRTLDECIVGGDCLGGDVMSLKLEKVKLRFGALMTDTAPFAFGVEGEIYPIKQD